jgi:hypothetical protein
MSIGAVTRIAIAMALLFVVVPALAWPRRRTTTWLEWFFWNVGVGIAGLTLAGQVLTLARLNSLLTLLLLLALVILIAHSVRRATPVWVTLRDASAQAFLVLLNVFDGRVSIPRRVRRAIRRARARLGEAMASRRAKLVACAWLGLTGIAATLRLYRPFSSANLGFSDTYVHLYLVKLLEDGRQVDPAWGPYPRGMHFLLMAIHQLTNVDEILLMNFFGAFAGVLMVLAVADAARRVSKSAGAGLLAGFLFATLIGGPGQYFVFGGAFDTQSEQALEAMPYPSIEAGEFDIALTNYQRQTSTLPQELAIALLFPAALFLRDFLQRNDRWHLVGFAGCTISIAAIHSGVLLPLALMSLLVIVMVVLQKSAARGALKTATVAGIASVAIGSLWALAFIAYPYAGGKHAETSVRSIESNPALLYYFPFLRSFGVTGPAVSEVEHSVVSMTPFLALASLLAVALLVLRGGDEEVRTGRRWLAATFLAFLLLHFASTLRLPELVELRRNSQWLAMAMTAMLGVALAMFGSWLRQARPQSSRWLAAATALLLVAWSSRLPLLADSAMRDRVINYSGYGTSALAVLRVEQQFEPYSWTIVSYGQEFPMVMQRGFHLSAADFLDRYDPQADVIAIPTPEIFLIVEKSAHRFQINTWSRQFSRSDLEQRLQTWAHLYQASHRNMRVFLEDESVRVYQITRTPEEIARSQKARP